MKDEDILKSLYRQVNQAMVAKDRNTLENLLVPDTFLIHMTGYVQPVSEWLDQIDSEEMKYYSWQESIIKDIHIEGYRASLIGQSRVKARVWGNGPTIWNLQMTVFFEKNNGEWKITRQVASTF
ncbi:nuclear transport factor 2 family protein [Listeria welshimeri]|nr:nuclear transport factor 2 family protein [Listeria welshimeri]